MKRLLVLLSLIALGIGGTEGFAQSRTVTGRVTAADTGRPLAGVTVVAQNSNVNTRTDAEGRYSINAPAGSNNLVFTALQYGMRTVPITGSVHDVTLSPQAVSLEGVVVTALGLERSERTLGVAAEAVAGEDLSRMETNIVNTLSGRVSGVNITGSSTPGGSSRIVIRGENSITGNNQPLFIIDGVPVDNYSNGAAAADAAGTAFVDYGNAMQDLNPDAIESITVLKGPNAAALYGSRAANGAVIITTKQGRSALGGAQISASQTVSFDDELRLPQYQNQYGQGLYGEYSYFDGDNNGTYDGEDQSWGPPLDAGLMIPQWHSPLDPATGERVPLPWVSQPNNVDEFFEVGTTATTNVSVAAGNDLMHGRFGISYLNQDGMLPGFELKRTTMSFGGGMDATDRLNLNTSIQYITHDGANRPGTGYNNANPMSQFIWFGRQVDTGLLRERWDDVFPEGDPNEGLPQNWQRHYWANPYQIQYSGENNDTRNRLIGQVSAGYQLTDWLNATVRTGTDWYQDNRLRGFGQHLYGGLYTDNPLTYEREYVNFETGAFNRWEIGFQESNTDFLFSANPDLNLPFTVNANFGGNRRDVERRTDYVFVGQLATPGIFDVSNAAITPDPFTSTARKRVNSLYGQTELGYNDYLYVTLTGRNDWSSTLPEGNNSYFYPSISSSFIFSDAISALQNSSLLSYGKVRASWARVGSDTDPYQLRNTFVADQKYGELPTFEVPGQLNNADLQPESTESWEVGAELAFLDNRVGLDMTYYDETTFDQIMPVSISRATGHTTRMVNAGTVNNRGVELLLRGTPIQTGDFRWETTLTWSKNENKVVELAEGVEGLELSAGDFWGAQIFAREGEPLGQIVGTDYLTVDDPDSEYFGQRVVHPLGIYRWTPTPKVIGNFNPDWRAGIGNEFSYKGATLNFLFDVKQGGEVYSVTHMFGRYAGVLEETLEGRCVFADEPLPGYPVCTAETGIVAPGVQRTIAAGDTTYAPNDVVIDSETFQLTSYYVSASNIVDAGFVKLREASLSFSLPSSLTERAGLSGLDISLTGRNLALWTKNPHIDPETAFENGNVQGFEYGQMPPTRSLGFSVSVRP